MIGNVQLPNSASLERTVEAVAKVEQIALQMPGVAHVVSIPGQSFVLNANSSNYANMFVILKPFAERHDPSLSGEAWGAPPAGTSWKARSSGGRPSQTGLLVLDSVPVDANT